METNHTEKQNIKKKPYSKAIAKEMELVPVTVLAASSAYSGGGSGGSSGSGSGSATLGGFSWDS